MSRRRFLESLGFVALTLVAGCAKLSPEEEAARLARKERYLRRRRARCNGRPDCY